MTDYKQVKPENPERQYTITNARAPPIEPIIQQSIHDDEHIDNVVFKILKLGGVDKDYLQNRIQESGDEEEQRILQRAVQVWERRQRLAELLADDLPIYEQTRNLREMIKQQLIEDEISCGLGGHPHMYGQVFELIDRFWINEWKPARVLDVGLGYGTLLHLLRMYDYEAVGLERGNNPFAFAEPTDGLTIYNGNIFSLPDGLRDQKFSITISTAMLDYDAFATDGLIEGDRIDEYRELFRRLALLTEPNGLSIHVHGNRVIYPDRYPTEILNQDDVLEVDGLFETLANELNPGYGYPYIVLRKTVQCPNRP